MYVNKIGQPFLHSNFLHSNIVVALLFCASVRIVGSFHHTKSKKYNQSQSHCKETFRRKNDG